MGKWSTNLVVTIRVHAVVMLSVLVGTVHVSTVLTSRKPAKQSCSHEERRHIKLWKHISAYRKGSSRGDEKAPRRKDAESDSAIINNKSSVISAGIISPGTARNKAGERVFQRRFSFLFSPPLPHLQTGFCLPRRRSNLPVCHTNFSQISSVYFQSSRKRHLLRRNPFPRHALAEPLEDRERHDYFISQRP